MKKTNWLILFVGCLLYISCSKSENKPIEDKVDPMEITHKKGYGSLIFGALGNGEAYILEIFKEGNPKAVATTMVYQFIDIKSPKNCKLQDVRARVVSLPKGKYVIKYQVPSETGNYKEFTMDVEENKCNAMNMTGYAW